MFYFMPQNVAHFPNISYLCAKHMLMKRLNYSSNTWRIAYHLLLYRQSGRKV